MFFLSDNAHVNKSLSRNSDGLIHGSQAKILRILQNEARNNICKNDL